MKRLFRTLLSGSIVAIFAVTFLGVVFFAVAATAQSNNGAISGTVFDSHGAVVAGANVIVIDIGTNQILQISTSDSGSFTASDLEPVIYRIEVDAKGFDKAIIESIKVNTATTSSANVTLRPAGVGTVISVTSEATLVNTESGATGQTITERQLADVPLVNRSVLDLAVTIPNVSGDAGSEDPPVTSNVPAPGFNLSVNGGRPGSTSILADGANNTGVGIARAIVSFSPETVQEFTVQTSAYSAEYGQTGGGVINVSTKSGNNRFTGTALWYTRNPSTNAKVWSTGSLHPSNNLRFNQVSGTLGGPVVLPKIYNGRDHTFFFVAVEPRFRRDFIAVNTILPTDAMRAGDFSGLTRTASGYLPTAIATQFGVPSVGPSTIYQQYNLVGNKMVPIVFPNLPTVPATKPPYAAFPGNVIPQNMLDPIALKALQYMPHAGAYFRDGSGNIMNYVVNRFVDQDETRYTARVDHSISDRNHINFRYTIVPSVGTKGFGSSVNGNAGTYSKAMQGALSDTHAFSASLINELRVNYTRGIFSDDFGPQYSVKTGQNLATQLGIPSLTVGGIPLLQISTDTNGYNAFSNIGAGGSTNNYDVEERYGLSDTVYVNHGAMSWKIGADVNHALMNATPFFGASGGRWDFRVVQTSSNASTSVANGGNPFASYLLGIPNIVLDRPVLITYHYRWNDGAAFVQNDWKVRPNMTLNLGLRYSLQFPRTEANNLQGSFLPALAQQFPLATPNTSLPGPPITSILVPPFAYAGLGGRSKYISPVKYLNFEPRLGIAWSPKPFGWNQNDHFVIRSGYALSHAPLTGNNRLPNPDFGGTVNVTTNATNLTTGPQPPAPPPAASTGTADPTSAVRFSSNPPVLGNLTPQQALNIPANGLVYLGGLAIPGFALSNNTSVPYVQNWNLTMEFQPLRNTLVEVAYVGSKGTHLFMPLINSNPRNFATITAFESGGLNNSEATIADPLGRKDLNGNVLQIPVGSLASQYAGFNHLYTYYDTSANSIRHAGYISLIHRVSQGLSFTSNYTYGKSMDDASDASPDKNLLTSGTTLGGNATFGAPRSSDYSVSSYDIRHTFNATAVYDLPFGRGRQLLANAWAPIQAIVGNWTVSSVFRLQGGYPFLPTIADGNGLTQDLTHTIRPDIIPGVPLVNPLYNRNCVTTTICEPYLNPAAFMRPVLGQLGNAPRTLSVRGPMQQYFDGSLQKSFPFPFGKSDDGKRRVQFRVDLLNALNHPNFRTASGNAGPDFMALPSSGATVSAPISNAEYDLWATANGKPLSTTPAGGATLTQIKNMVNSTRATPTSGLPLDFFHVPVPQGFNTSLATSYDITTLPGFKLYRLRQAYSPAFGQLRELGQPRFIQLGLKIYF